MCVSDISITEDDIQFAEQILFSNGETFQDDNDERISFITELSTLDLHAVPGSGKTTALLAKLLILERKLPFIDGSGILVISHTNTAINEIKNKIGKYCPKLFSYPNFIGTIQSFVDIFLAQPFAHNILNTNFRYIDTEKYQSDLLNKFNNIYWDREYDKPGTLFWGRHIKKSREIAATDEKVEDTCKEFIEKEVKSLYYNFDDQKIKLLNDDTVILANPKNKKYQGIKSIILDVLNSGTVSYEYAYKLGFSYLNKFPKAKKMIQSRFKFVFVDEMQDMNKIQYKILEDLFYDSDSSDSIYQRIGDKNQAIYGGDVSLENIWKVRTNKLELTGSYRLSNKIANVVKYFALSYQNIEGWRIKDDNSLKPIIMVYDDETCRCKVIQKFVEIIKDYQMEGLIPIDYNNPIKAVAWRKQSNEKSKISLYDYCPDSKKEKVKANKKNDYDTLKSCLVNYDGSIKILREIHSQILTGLVKVLRIEGVKDVEDKFYTKNKLLKYIKENHPIEYEDLKLNLYNWCISIIKGNENDTLSNIRIYMERFLLIFDCHTNQSQDFIYSDTVMETDDSSEIGTGDNNDSDCELCKINEEKIKIDTVHSVKGETHTATLYLESYYYKDGNGENAKSYESQRLSNQFKKEKLNSKCKKREKQSAKMMYVGFSRPTHLLAFAVHKDRYSQYLSDVDTDIWKVIKV